MTPNAGQPVRCAQGGLLGRIRSALYRESLVWLILLSFGSVERGQTAECKKCSKWLKYKTLIPDLSSRIDSQGWSACQVWSEWTPQPDPVGVVHGEAGLQTLKSCTFTKKKVVFFTLCRFFSTDCLCFCWLLGATFGPPSHATFWSKHQMFEL